MVLSVEMRRQNSGNSARNPASQLWKCATASAASRIPSIPARTCRASSSPNSANLSCFFARSNMKFGISQRIVLPLRVVAAA